MMRRRSFVIGTGLIVAGPAFAVSWPMPQAGAVPAAALSLDVAAAGGLRFKIAGWDLIESAKSDAAGDVFFRLDRNGRAAWR